MTAEQMKDARAKLGMSQPQFAIKIGVSSSAVKAWEQGRNPIPLAIEILVGHLLKAAK